MPLWIKIILFNIKIFNINLQKKIIIFIYICLAFWIWVDKIMTEDWVNYDWVNKNINKVNGNMTFFSSKELLFNQKNTPKTVILWNIVNI